MNTKPTLSVALAGATAGPGGLAGFNWPLYPGVGLGSSKPLAPDAWHHIAFVQGGGTQRLYLNGQIVGTRPAAGDIGDSDGGGFVGAIFRDGGIAPSFIGHLDALRVSNVARYSGDSFEAPTGSLPQIAIRRYSTTST
jgi:hypothetical protein